MTSSNVLEEYIEFENKDTIMLPKVCLVCGKKTDIFHKISKQGTFNRITYETIHHHFSIPICKKCKKKVIPKKAKQKKLKKKTVLSAILGLITAIIIGIFTYSLIFGLTIFIISLVIPYSNYRIKRGGGVFAV